MVVLKHKKPFNAEGFFNRLIHVVVELQYAKFRIFCLKQRKRR